jgi:tetratricopeptide (TPR) repeat protein
MPRRALICGFPLTLLVGSGVLHARQPPVSPARADAAALQQRANELADNERWVESEKTCRAALQEYEAQAAGHVNDVAYRLRWGACRNLLGEVQVHLFQFTEAKALFAGTVPFLQQAAALAPKEPGGRFELARTYKLWSICDHDAGWWAEAAVHQGEAIGLVRQLVQEHPDRADYREELRDVLAQHGAELMHLARYQDADRAYQESLRLGQHLVAAFPRSPHYAERLAATTNAYALLVRESGEYARAAVLTREAIRLLAKLEAEYPDQPQHWHHLPACYRNLALPLGYLHREAEKKAAEREALRLETKLAQTPKSAQRKWFTEADQVFSSFRAGDAERLVGQQTEVDQVLREAEEEARANPQFPRFRSRLIAAKLLVAGRLLAIPAPEEAQRSFQEVEHLAEQLAAALPGVPQYRLAWAKACQAKSMGDFLAGNTAEGEREYQKGLAICNQLADEFPQIPQLRYQAAEAITQLCMFKTSRGELAESRRYFVASLAVLKRLAEAFPTCPQYRRQLTEGYFTLANLCLGTGDDAEAEAALREGLRLWPQMVADFPSVAEYRLAWGNMYMALGNFHVQRGQVAKAEEAYGQMIRILQRLVDDFPKEPRYHAVLANGYGWYGALMDKQQRLPESLAYGTRTVSGYETAVRLEPHLREWLTGLHDALRQRAFLHQQLGHTAETESDRRRVAELEERLETPLLRLVRIRSRLEADEVERAVQEADDLALDEDLTDAQWCELAELYAAAAAKTDDDDAKETRAGKAVEALRQAVAKGYTSATPLGAQARFRLLWERTAFRKLAAAKPQ